MDSDREDELKNALKTSARYCQRSSSRPEQFKARHNGATYVRFGKLQKVRGAPSKGLGDKEERDYRVSDPAARHGIFRGWS